MNSDIVNCRRESFPYTSKDRLHCLLMERIDKTFLLTIIWQMCTTHNVTANDRSILMKDNLHCSPIVVKSCKLD